MTTIFFACSGNTCRSPMAAEILRQIVEKYGIEDLETDCFGIHPYLEDDAEVRRLREQALIESTGSKGRIIEHVPKGFEEASISQGDKIILLQKDLLEALCEKMKLRGISLPILILDIADPFGQGYHEYLECCRTLRDEIEDNMLWILGSSYRDSFAK
ncbi:MAG: hypothetical protein OEV21_01530 [Thermoplasmata archaeon]|nr:hypothetical protein [Thermoplasmata archaeon]